MALTNQDFDIISYRSSRAIYGEWEEHVSNPTVNTDAQVHRFLREHFPELTITSILTGSVPLVAFANAGHATAELDTKTDMTLRWRAYVPPTHRGEKGHLADSVIFAKYHYVWEQEDFILYTVTEGYYQVQYILKEPGPDEDIRSNCAKSDALITKAIEVFTGNVDEYVYVFDGYWSRSKELWDEVMKSSWDKVILDPEMKKSLQDVSSTFFDSKELYDRYGVPWKRGLIFAGPPGNGKTISIKALMKTLYKRKDPIPALYVKSATSIVALNVIFRQARAMTPCLLVMEDIETIVTPNTRSYFFNELDGLANNGGLLMVASTNYLDRLDPGLSKRPSRFDRKFIFPLPNEHERTLYADFWREKLKKSHFDLPFPQKLCPAMANITFGFSFAYMQEAFIATLLVLAREASGKGLENPLRQDLNSEVSQKPVDENDGGDGDGDDDGGDDDLMGYKLWRVFRDEVAELRKDMNQQKDLRSAANAQPEEMHQPSIYSMADISDFPPYLAGHANTIGYPGQSDAWVSTGLPVQEAKIDPRMMGGFSHPGHPTASHDFTSNGMHSQRFMPHGAHKWSSRQL